MTTIKVSGAGFNDMTFSIEHEGEELMWNVTKIRQAANRGLFDPLVRIPMDCLPPPDYSTGNLELDRIAWIKDHPEILNEPGLAIAAPDGSDYGILCMCDGNHRITARWELKLPDFDVFIVPWPVQFLYRAKIELIKGDRLAGLTRARK